MLAGGVEVPQPDRFTPAVVNVRTGVGQRQRCGRSGETQQRQGGEVGSGARPHATGGAQRDAEARAGTRGDAQRQPGAVRAGLASGM